MKMFIRIFSAQDDYFWDDSGDAVPVRWLAPEALHYDSSDTSVTVGHITKASNVWYVVSRYFCSSDPIHVTVSPSSHFKMITIIL